MSLHLGIVIIALAVLFGGLAAAFREPARWAMSAIRTFAVVAAAAIALLHLLPEALADIHGGAILAAGLGAFGPMVLERLIPSGGHDHSHDVPTTSLTMGYAAVVAHQAGEGAALASLAQTGALSISIVLAVAAHTVPLAMVVALRVLEVKGGAARGSRRAIGIALIGVIAATAIGAGSATFIGSARLVAAKPWLLASVAGLLLHALSHDVLAKPAPTLPGRFLDTMAGWAGLGLAVLGVERGGWLETIPLGVRLSGIVLLSLVIAVRSFIPWRSTHQHQRPSNP